MTVAERPRVPPVLKPPRPESSSDRVATARTAAKLYLSRNQPGDAYLALSNLRICCDADPTDVPTLELLARAFDMAGHEEKAARVRREIALMARAPKGASRPAPKRQVHEDSIEVVWEDVAEEEERIDPNRPSFWPEGSESASKVEEPSVVLLSVADVELVDPTPPKPPESGERVISVLETALERIQEFVAEGRFEEALVLIAHHLSARPNHRLLLEQRAEIERLRNAHLQGPPPALFGMAPKARGRK